MSFIYLVKAIKVVGSINGLKGRQFGVLITASDETVLPDEFGAGPL